MDIHKTGREIDLKARHRLEERVAVAECKATKTPVGGAVLNKFAGVLQKEAAVASPTPVQGYFVSLGGFRQSAREQEEEAGTPRFILLDADGIQKELVAGGLVTAPIDVCQTAGGLAASEPLISRCSDPELIGHSLGWLWLCIFEKDHVPSHFALIHADGRPIDEKLANLVVEADKTDGGGLGDLSYLGPSATKGQVASTKKAAEKYQRYLLAELGEITLEGLPADEEIGARRIALEDLYVPLKVERSTKDTQDTARLDSRERDTDDTAAEHVESRFQESGDEDGESNELLGHVLSRNQRLALLADPGAGKSTLIKRLAVAYASSTHREKISDALPETDWLPIFIRCRTLGEKARLPIRDILDEIPRFGEFPDYTVEFGDLVTQSLREGKVLLLIDGLDEISDEGDRLAFVRQLRTFLSIYPNVALVLTSRRAGFRAVGGAVSSICRWYRLAEFDDDDIRALTLAWHGTVVGKGTKTATDAGQLADTIITTDRVRRLARNPLLLTTLLLVKRWVGDLPRKRSVLYEKAIEVLLMTWNVEAHEPIDRDEAIPQLAYVAHAMTSQGTQSLDASTLTYLLEQARTKMPEVLGFARTSVATFVDQIENRSSLLIMTGHSERNGQLVANYEFRHLTFQEYLTAVAIVEGFHESHNESDDLPGQLQPHLFDPRWQEVVTLANVRAGRAASKVIELILEAVDEVDEEEEVDIARLGFFLLARALADEVQLTPELVTRTAQTIGSSLRMAADQIELYSEIIEGRYGSVFVDVIESGFLNDDTEEFARFGTSFSALTRAQRVELLRDDEATKVEITKMLERDDEREIARAALLAMYVAFSERTGRLRTERKNSENAELKAWSRRMIELCQDGRPYLQFSGAWALVWLTALGAIDSTDVPSGLKATLRVWGDANGKWLKKLGAWAFASFPAVPRESYPLGVATAELCEFIENEVSSEGATWRQDRVPAALILGYYLGKPWDDDALKKQVREKDMEGFEKGPLANLLSD